MNEILLFFAIPLLVIVVSIILEKILNNPLLVAAFVFAVFLVVFFILGEINLLVAVIAYTILALITALLVRAIKCLMRRLCDRDEDTGCNILSDEEETNNNCGCNRGNNFKCPKHK